MVVKKKTKVKAVKKVVKKTEEEEGGMDLDDAFGDDDDVEYAETKPKKVKKSKEGVDEDLEAEVNAIEKKRNSEVEGDIKIKGSKAISQLKKGDKVKIDGNECEVDAHSMLMDHDGTKEMALDVFDKKDKDYQIRYFADQVERTMDVYELQEIIYVKKPVKKIEW